MPDTTSISVSWLIPARKRFFLIFQDVGLRPPVMEEMDHDIRQLAASISRKYTDVSCPQLQYEDLHAECMYKLSFCLTRNKIDPIPNRREAFKYIKTVFNNHVKSLVSKYRMTAKRGGKRSEDLSEENAGVYTKNVDLSVDDADHNLQIADPGGEWSSASSFIDDIAIFLTPAELMVLKEYNQPSARTMHYASLDAAIGQVVGEESNKVKVKTHHFARGLGVETIALKEILANLGKKIKDIQMSESSDEAISWNRAITRLEEVFGIEIPESLEKLVIRRILTIAARDQYDSKVADNTPVQEDLELVGAKVPESRGGHLSCRGVLFQKTHRTCIACGLNKVCSVESANFGLGDITLSPRLLGARGIRVPMVLSTESQLLTPREEEIYAYLREHFDPLASGSEMGFKHRDSNAIAVSVTTAPFGLKLIKPAEELKPELVKVGTQYFALDSYSASQVIELVSRHAHAMFLADTLAN